MTLPILLIEGDPARARALRAALALEVSDAVIWVDTLADALCELAARSMTCILLNLDLSDGAGVPLVDALMSAYPEVPIVVLDGREQAAVAVDTAVAIDAAFASDALHRGAEPVVGMVGSAVSFAVERVDPAAERAQHDMQYRAVVESLGEGLLVLSASGRIQSWNRAAEVIFGRTRDEMFGRSGRTPFGGTVDDARRPITPDDYPGAIAIRTGQPVTDMTIGFQQPNGNARWVSVSAYPMRNEVDGRLYGAVVSLRDVTSYRAALEATQFQAGLLDAVAQAVLATDPAGIITYWNKAAERLYGWSAAEALGQNVLDVVPTAHSRAESEAILAGLDLGESWTGVIDAHDRDGRVFPAEVTVTPVFDGDGVVTAIIGVSTDVTERRRTEDAMRQLSAIVESSDDAIIGTALDATVLSWNRGAERLYGRPASAALGVKVYDFASPGDTRNHAGVFARVARTGTAEQFDTVSVRPDGGKSEISLALSPVYAGSGAVTGFSIIGRDVTARNTAERALVHQSLHDDLTGLPNRALLEDRIVQVLAWARLHHRLVAVYFLDLDEFKLVNDGFGHVAGDTVLVEIASRLREALRPEDTVARFGGDEFVVVCEVGSTSAAAQVGSRLLAAVEAPFALHGEEAIVTCSIGLTIAGADATPAGLLQDCDAAMYRAKARGRSRLEFFDETSRASSAGRLQTTTALRRALERDELRVFFQPVVSMIDARPVGVEALVRWQHPERGLVPPDDFIPLAESTGLIVPIGSWVLHEALLQRAKWEAALPGHPPLRLAVNLSARQLSDPGLISDVTAALAESGAAPGSLVLEITESVLMEDRDSWATLHALRDLGISLHVDDFGTGYSSLAYLKSLPVDALKVDRSFVDGLGTTPEDTSIVTAVMSLASTLSLAVVAEGVETELQLDVLRGLGCDYAQGFLFARPLPYDELVGWLARTAAPARRV